MYNPSLDTLTDYPFDKLRSLLKDIEPPRDQAQIIMSLGEPQHPAPKIISETINKYQDYWTQYPPIAGTPDLLQAISDWLQQRYKLNKSIIVASENIVAVSGTREALYMLGDISIPRKKNNAKPAVLIPNPFYQVYIGTTLMNEADPIYLPATKETEFLPDLNSLDEATLKRTALAFLCSPSNPQGTVADIEYLENAIKLAQKYDFVLAIDECYAEIYHQLPPPGGLQACQNLGGNLKNVLVFHTLSKRSNAAGLRSGFVAGDKSLIRKYKMLRNYGGASLPMPLLAASAALWRDNKHVELNRSLYHEKFDCADQILSGCLGYYRPEGGFYLWLNVGDGETAARALWENSGVRVIPGSFLAKPNNKGDNPGTAFIRVALVHDRNIVEDALKRILKTLG